MNTAETVIKPDTNARGWALWVLLDMDTHEVMRSEYKSDKEAKDDNIVIKKYVKGKNWRWVLNDNTKYATTQ